MKIRTPQEIGLPEKFSNWREGQEEVVEAILTDRTRHTDICAGTGFGKTAAYMAGALESGKATCIVTNSKGLQDQLMDDFSSIGLVDIRGRVNYTCDMKPGYTCEDGFSAQCPYKDTPACPSSKAEMRAAVSNLVVTNYEKWIAARKYSTGMTHFEQVIFDEGHHLPTALAKAMQVTLHFKEIQETLHLDFPSSRDTMDEWKSWLQDTRIIVEEEVKITSEEVKVGGTSVKYSVIRHLNHMRNLLKNLATLSTASSANWIVEEMDNGFQFDPISPARYAEGIMFLRIPKVVMISATLRRKTLAMSGISRQLSQFKEFNSTFKRSQSPIYWIKTMKVDWNNRHDLQPVWNRLDQIAGRRRDRKGIVHTVSYNRRDQIAAHSRYSSSMVFNEKGEPTPDALRAYREGGPGTILVSPIVGTGYDFPGNECEWQFVCKIPFVPGKSKIIKARQELDREYGPYHAMQTLVQMFGRGTRRDTDWCENFIPDDNCAWFIPKYAHLAPKSFYGDMANNIEGFYRDITMLPAPPPALGGF